MTPPPATDICGLLDRYERPLVRYAQSIVGDLESARDVVQDTFIRYVRLTSGVVESEETDDAMSQATITAGTDAEAPAYSVPPPLEGDHTRHLEAWLFTVTRNRALDHVRKYSRIVPMELPEERASAERGPDAELASRDTTAWLLKLLDGLTPNQREVIRLKFQSDLSYKEISDVTGLSVTNVGFLLHVGLKKLRTIITESPTTEIPIPIRTAL